MIASLAPLPSVSSESYVSSESLDLEPPGGEPRLVCYTCFRPAALCYCDHTSRLDNRTHVTVVQHPREQFHPLGTARIVARALANVELIVAHPGWARRGAERLFPAGAALLYPGRGARELASLPATERPPALVVLDGTWHHARTLYRDHPVFHELPLVHFMPERPTEYRVRREPKAEYVSTVEAVATALDLLEPGLGARELLPPFRRMIDLHLAATERAERKPRHRRQRSVQARALPRALAEEFERVVVIYGEANPIGPPEGPHPRRPRQPPPLVYWTAKRLRDGAVFAEFARPDPPLSERRREMMGVAARDLETAGSLSELKARWRAFLGPDDLCLAWNKSSLDLMQALDADLAPGLVPASLTLKAVYRGFGPARIKKGALDDVVAAEGLEWQPVPIAGRASERLGRAEAVARYLHAYAG